MAIKDLFVPKLVDNSPKGWVRFGGQTLVQSVATTAGMYGGILLVAAAYALWNEKIEKLEEENENLKLQLQLEKNVVNSFNDQF